MTEDLPNDHYRRTGSLEPSRRLLYDPVGPWHRWFAWRPVNTVTHGWKWLCAVERQRVQKKLHLPGPTDQFWDYRPIPTREDQSHD